MHLAQTHGVLGPEIGPISQALKNKKNKNGWPNLDQPLISDSAHPKHSKNVFGV
jgi:hypothetical protein